jgi:DNA-directed RNA polymerase specialized sigma24 family protein
MSEIFWAATAPKEFTSEEGAANLRRLVRNFIRARVADAATIDDLTQDVVVKVERAAASLSEASKDGVNLGRFRRHISGRAR